jgi:XTP/dITP diphosphohydrolase
MPQQLVLATHNKHKAEELHAMLANSGIEVLTLDAFPSVKEIIEDQPTLEGNAMKKAQEIFLATSLPSLADDTGLEVEYLNGEPGVFSARYSGPGATYASNVKKLLDELRGVPPYRRKARFRSVLAFVAPNNFERQTEGICPGVITEERRGTHGFGYDPIFLPDGYNQTFAEMSLELKNTLSHRAKALMSMSEVLRAYFGS